MPWATSTELIYKVVTQDSVDLQVGQVVYYQEGLFGTPIGLLVSLTKTPLYTKMLKTNNGLRRLS